MENLETLAKWVVMPHEDHKTVKVLHTARNDVSVQCHDLEWRGSVAEWQAALLAALSANDTNYPQLTDWVRAQPEGSRLLAVFRDGELIPAVAVQDNHGKRLDDCYENALRGRMSGGLGYTAVWLSRETSEHCEALIPRSVKVYRER